MIALIRALQKNIRLMIICLKAFNAMGPSIEIMTEYITNKKKCALLELIN